MILAAILLSCQQRQEVDSETAIFGFGGEKASVNCGATIDVKPYVYKRYRCTTERFFNEKKMLFKPVPCNKVSLVVHPDSPLDTHLKTQKWLEGLDGFSKQDAETILKDSTKPTEIFSKSPIATSKMHQAIVETIRYAKKTIFFDIFLFGGYWGTEIARELIEASKRGVRVLVLHDTENPFFFRSEIDPVWNALKLYSSSLKKPNLVALRPNIHLRPTGLPEALGEPLKPFLKHFNHGTDIEQVQQSYFFLSGRPISFCKFN